MISILESSRGGLAVSCQASEDSPLHSAQNIAALARAAVMGGAHALRIEGVGNVAAVHGAVAVPVIGITKISQAGSRRGLRRNDSLRLHAIFRTGEAPDFVLMRALASSKIPFVSEGRIWQPAEARLAIEYGAMFVVVGSAITRPDVITGRFADAVAGLAA